MIAQSQVRGTPNLPYSGETPHTVKVQAGGQTTTYQGEPNLDKTHPRDEEGTQPTLLSLRATPAKNYFRQLTPTSTNKRKGNPTFSAQPGGTLCYHLLSDTRANP